MNKIAVFAGSFCPFTKGHEDILQKVLPLFDKVYVAVGHNFQKKDMFSVEQRLTWIRQLYKDEPKVEVVSYQGLTTDLCAELGAQYLIRGLRNTADYMMEQEMCQVNGRLTPSVQTIFIPASPQWAPVSSSLVRELWSLQVDYSPYVSFELPNVE